MDEREKNIRLKLKNDFEHYAAKCLKVRIKEGSNITGELPSFVLNKAQKHVHSLVEKQKRETGKIRAAILKGRQQGISTYVGGRIYHQITHRTGVRAFILAHEAEATNNLFDMAQRYHENCPLIVRPETTASSSKELFFGILDSGYKVGTAGNKGAGRSSTIQYLHGSEVAFWPNADEHSKGIIQAVPDAVGTEIFLESTANGIGNYFHEQWQLAESQRSDFIPIFVPWFWQEEYQRPIVEEFQFQEGERELVELYDLNVHQLLWRRAKIQGLSGSGGNGLKAFMQEYPCNAVEAFQMSGADTLIDPALVMRARQTVCEPVGPLIVGVDPARFGDDRSSIIYRRTRVAYNLRSYSKKDTMEVAGIVRSLIIEDSPERVNIDVGGLGAGVYDRLVELGFKDVVRAINSGSTPLNADKYVNKRAEMWGLAHLWLQNAPVQLPDCDSLHADLTSCKYTYDSLSRLVIEKKEMMKKRGLRSPDEADAFCLTFAEPIEALHNNKRQEESIANHVMSQFNNLQRIRANRS